MRTLFIAVALLSGGISMAEAAERAPSVEWGRHVSITSGCNDCHTPGYAESGGTLDPKTALTGVAVGFSGPWGTTYAANLRLTVAKMSEDAWVTYGKSFETRPPMPWYNVHEMTDGELRSFYMYVKSLGAPGQPAPQGLPPGETPQTPFIVFAPPQMPQ
ncbi:hypothetical protein NPA31_012590 [Aurantimonas sp. MSK8Z-1]|uniref:hypothetical protein n=1 Tax=Mangrovibrevibacter kandeliae TaxID=2968473 RepID=UPI00223088C9|nr:hypothetical protein [Aurantimonas sp. MSK8Z-1]MCW4115799.1 hypothetical protein [Aurantimonas sp. MSK8Z-1]